jgi:hypothetical protein
MRPGHHGQPIPDHARAARAYFWEGKPLKHALIEAGYSAEQAKKGFWATVKESAPLRQALKNEKRKSDKFLALLPPPGLRVDIIRARLLKIVMSGESSVAIAAAKLLGRTASCACGEPDQAVGVQVNVVPADWKERFERKRVTMG